MTQQDYDNLRVNFSYYQGQLASDIVRRLKIGSCDTDKLLVDLRVGSIILSMLSCYQIEKQEYNITVTVRSDGAGNIALPSNINLSGIIPGDNATSDYLPAGTKVVDIDGHNITFDHGFISVPSAFDITLSRVNDINNCITTVQALSLLDVLNRIYNVNFCCNLVLDSYV